MSESKTKRVTTIIISFVIVAMLFAIFVLIFNSQKDDITYIVDQNRCAWEQGVIVERTTEVGLMLTTEDVAPEDEEEYLAQAEAESRCVVRLGDDRGSFARQLNEEYDLNR